MSDYSQQDELQEVVEQQELYEHFSIVVDKGQSPLRVDKFLSIKIEGTSRTRIRNASDADCILVNDEPVKANYKVKSGDRVSLVLPEEPRELILIAEDIPLNVVYEDADVIVIDKQPGLVVHPGVGNYTGTLVNALAYHITDSELFTKENTRPGLVHRIDKNTSGLLVVAKTQIALNHLSKQFFEHTTDRKYEALIWGSFPKDEGIITGYLARDVKNRKKMHLYDNEDEGKWSVTHYKVLESIGYVSRVECQLETGRTHQIRAHFEHLKHPIFNDERYGGDRVLKGTTFTKYKQFVENTFKVLPRHALHAKLLGFTHPITNERMVFESPIPDDMSQAYERWRNYISNRKEV